MGPTFEFARLKDQQYTFLQEFQEKAGQGYLVIGVTRNEIEVYLISFTNYCNLRQRSAKKSINFALDYRNFRDLFIRLPRVKLRTEYYVDFSPLSDPSQKLETFLKKD